ncbi:zona pellucida sperm-binding protein 3 receptor-like [Haliotis cracherodii]|uniref:zona pellucida sperm-binding protein 3 receptor-like n=1 Tax=Haliotis cracherodii TaxID=6455 RepID=UPI0039E7DAD7
MADTMLILLKLATDVCGPPPTVKRSTVKYTSLAVGARAVYTCHRGFQATRTPSIRCLADSTWTKVAFSCKQTGCGKPPAITHATVAKTPFSSIATYTCNQGYIKRSGSTTIACQANGKWAASNLRCSYFVYIGNNILAMRIVSGNRVSSVSTWKNKKIFYDAPISKSLQAGCLTGNAALPCTKHFRSVLVNNWSKIGVKQVHVLIMKSGRLMKKLIFNGVRSSSTKWLSKSRLLKSSWKDLGKRSRTNYFSLNGARSFRRWYISRSWGGCNSDRGWLLVKDSASGTCRYDKGSSFPRIRYSRKSTYDKSYKYAMADTMLILLKLATDVCGPPPTVKRSTVKYTSLAVGARAVYTCHRGFQATRTPSIRCLADSTWTKVAFSCKQTGCGKPPAITHATVAKTPFSSIATYTCNQGYIKRSGSTTIACQANGKWAASNLRCSYFVYIGNNILAMRIVSGNRVSSVSTWKNKKIFYDAPISKSLQAGCLTGNAALPCTKHFRSVLVNNWSKIGVKQVHVLIMKSGRLMKKLIFNGVRSSSTKWLSKSRLLKSSWKDLGKRSRTNYFSLNGARSFRRWYISRSWGGCNSDRGWLLVKDSASGTCRYDKGSSFPRIRYSRKSTYDKSYKYAMADTMLILLKLATDVCGPPPTVKRSTVKYTSLAVGARAVYTCHRGFQATRTPSIRCLADSTWTKVAFSCKLPSGGQNAPIFSDTCGIVTIR